MEPVDGLVHHELAGVSLGGTDRRSIANEVAGIPMAGRSVVPGGEPIVESVLIGCGLVSFCCWEAQVPFSDVSGGVTLCFQDFGQGHFSKQKMGTLAGVVDPAIDARPDVVSAGQ